MKRQLVDSYLVNNDCYHGIYLVGWFLCDFWSKADSRRKNLPFRKIELANAFLNKQAEAFSKGPLRLRAKILDGSLLSAKKRSVV
jgi:hypothetical protein